MTYQDITEFDPKNIVLRDSDPVKESKQTFMFRLAHRQRGRALKFQTPFWAMPMDVEPRSGNFGGMFCNIVMAHNPDIADICKVKRVMDGVDARCREILKDFDPQQFEVTRGRLDRFDDNDFVHTKRAKGYNASFRGKDDYPEIWGARVAFDDSTLDLKVPFFYLPPGGGNPQPHKDPIKKIKKGTRISMIVRIAYISCNDKGISLACFCEQILLGAGGLSSGGGVSEFAITSDVRAEQEQQVDSGEGDAAGQGSVEGRGGGSGSVEGEGEGSIGDDAFENLIIPPSMGSSSGDNYSDKNAQKSVSQSVSQVFDPTTNKARRRDETNGGPLHMDMDRISQLSKRAREDGWC